MKLMTLTRCQCIFYLYNEAENGYRNKKEIDRLGRIVIPKEFRERFGIEKEVEIIATESGILIRSPEYILVKADKNTNR